MPDVVEKVLCHHCGDVCNEENILFDGKSFCCFGCKTVYEILKENQLCSYYDLNQAPGIKFKSPAANRFNFLDEKEIIERLISFRKNDEVHVTFYIPEIHCSSCIWLLENFKRVDAGIIHSSVDFTKKEVSIVFSDQKTSLRKITESLTLIGYEPSIQLDKYERKIKSGKKKNRILRIGIAGFCFGNIMMLSFPEYFSGGNNIDDSLKHFFSTLILILALPVFIFSASEFYIRSFQSLRQKKTSIDVPIAIGIIAIFLRSLYEIVSGTGPGYFDSGSGLIFLMLIGRWFQDFTFDALSFERDYKSYFPIAITTLKGKREKITAVNDLKINDRILVRNNEIIPVDGKLLKGEASIDYSFVTGESTPVSVKTGEQIYAGGKQTGGMLEILVSKEIAQSRITQLWNNSGKKSVISNFDVLVNNISRYFIIGTLFIATASAVYWWNTDISKAVNAFTCVLVIACPCALALSAPFTYGNIIRILGRKKIYLRNAHVIENLADADTVVFDKTGTLTYNNSSNITFAGDDLSDYEKKLIASLVRNSGHPLSRYLFRHLNQTDLSEVRNYNEKAGLGISGIIDEHEIKAGNDEFILGKKINDVDNSSRVYISIGGTCKGYFQFRNNYREGLEDLSGNLLQKKFSLFILSGDDDAEKDLLKKTLGDQVALHFRQSPTDKAEFIRNIQSAKSNVIMIGDGLNDAGALLQSNVGISIADNTNNFTPASDIIMDASRLNSLHKLIVFSKSAVRIIIWSFIISLLYNFIGLAYASTGTLSPLIAAILMPISTISLVLFTVISSSIRGRMLGFK